MKCGYADRVRVRAIWLTFLVLAGWAGAQSLRVAVATTLADSGLFGVLAEDFERGSGVGLTVIPAGSGQGLNMLARGDVDAAVIHAPGLEAEALAQGKAADGGCFAYNHFVIAGPEADPAQVGLASSIQEAFTRIASSQSLFVSRGDHSGTHEKELELWRKASISPEGKWYLEVGAGAGAALLLASERGAYLLIDQGTLASVQVRPGIKILYQAQEPIVLNRYRILLAGPVAETLAQYLATPAAQQIISSFGGGGKFFPWQGECGDLGDH